MRFLSSTTFRNLWVAFWLAVLSLGLLAIAKLPTVAVAAPLVDVAQCLL